MRRKILLIIATIIFAVGAVFLAYPLITEWFYGRQVAEISARFEQDIDERNKLLDELYLTLSGENKRLYEEGQVGLKDPFSYETPGIDLRNYGITDNIIGFITIPKIHQQLPIYLGASEENMQKGAVHLTQTSYPIGGDNTNSVLAAHRGYRKAAMFRNIDELVVGDQVIISNFHETITYQVVGTEIIDPDEYEKIMIQPGKDRVTLMTCHPYTKSTYRYLVYCERSQI